MARGGLGRRRDAPRDAVRDVVPWRKRRNARPRPPRATPNIPFRIIRDFLALCRAEGITVEKSTALKHDAANGGFSASGFLPNLLGERCCGLPSSPDNLRVRLEMN